MNRKKRVSLTHYFLGLYFFALALPLIGVFALVGFYLFQSAIHQDEEKFTNNSQSVGLAAQTSVHRLVDRLRNLPLGALNNQEIISEVNDTMNLEKQIAEVSVYERTIVEGMGQFQPITRIENRSFLQRFGLPVGSLLTVNITTTIKPSLLEKNQVLVQKAYTTPELPLIKLILVRLEYNRTFVLTAHLDLSLPLIGLLSQTELNGFYLDKDNAIISLDSEGNILQEDLNAIAEETRNSTSATGERFSWTSSTKQQLFGYTVPVHLANMRFLAIKPQVKPLKTMQNILAIGLMALATILVYDLLSLLMFSFRLNRTLRIFEEALEKVSRGFWETRLQVKLGAEFAQISERFNRMTDVIGRALKEKSNKEEASNLRNMQKTLFPSVDLVTDSYEISSYYKPSDTMGGDWWNFFIHDHHMILVAGNVNQDGIPAALLKANAQGFFNGLETMLQAGGGPKDRSPKAILTQLNKVIHRWSRGASSFHFLYCDLDLRNGVIQYANLGYSYPLVCRTPQAEKLGTERSVDHITVFDGSSEGSIGEREHIVAHEYKDILHPGDVMVILSPGLMCMRQKEMEQRVVFFKEFIAKHSHQHAKEIKFNLQEKIDDLDVPGMKTTDSSFLVLKVFDRIYLKNDKAA